MQTNQIVTQDLNFGKNSSKEKWLSESTKITLKITQEIHIDKKNELNHCTRCKINNNKCCIYTAFNNVYICFPIQIRPGLTGAICSICSVRLASYALQYNCAALWVEIKMAYENFHFIRIFHFDWHQTASVYLFFGI